jgi:hypothetical protein
VTIRAASLSVLIFAVPDRPRLNMTYSSLDLAKRVITSSLDAHPKVVPSSPIRRSKSARKSFLLSGSLTSRSMKVWMPRQKSKR